GFDGRCPIRGWLYRIATNACLDLIERRPKRVLSIEQSPPYGAWQAVTTADALGMELYPDRLLEEGEAVPDTCYERREAVRLAYAMAVKHLAPRQRAVLVLRDVLGFSAEEVSNVLRTTVTSVNSALQRARTAVDQRVPDKSQLATVRALGDARTHEVVTRFVDAFERADVDEVVAVLAEDAYSGRPSDTRCAVTPIVASRTKRPVPSGLPSELAA